MIRNWHITPDNRGMLGARINSLDPTKDWVCNITEKKSRRSNEQNSRLWKLYTELGRHIGETPDAMHELMGFKFLRELKTINGESVEVIKSTTKLNTAEMVEYQDAIENWAAQIGFIFETE